MATFIAHYTSPNASATRATGLFEFESASRLGSKANQSDARMHMLETFGKEAVSWSITGIERKTASSTEVDGQLAIDFREPPRERTRRKSVDRGIVK